MKVLSQWLYSREARERCLLIIAFSVCVLGLVIISFRAATSYRDNSFQRLKLEQKALNTLPEYERVLQQQITFKKFPVVNVADLHKQALDMGLALQLTQHQDTIRLDQSVVVSFPLLLSWLQQIEHRWGVQASRLKLVREKQNIKLIQMELIHAL
ncbi:hypothetical protein ACOZB2_29830 [Pantoea endophytica]|uniref:Type II secretion system protein M n=1 Tax=Pantoea sp. BJ2 TaxID=3141322 RepID=A0AAU7U3G9_9GAMM